MTLSALRRAPCARHLTEAVDEAYRRLDELASGIPFQPPLACRRGCNHCCYNQVSLSQPEALRLGLHLLDTRNGQQLGALVLRTAGVLQRIAGKQVLEIGALRHELPCIFLEHGTCSVYPARPLACRGWNSVNEEQCRQSLEQRDPLALIENHPLLRELADGIQGALLQGAAELGLEAGFLTLPRAMQLTLDLGPAAAEEAWLQGAPFFALFSHAR